MEYMSTIQSVWTLIAFVVFIGIIVWAWSSNRQNDFNEAANLVFDEADDDMPHANVQSKSGN